MITVNYNSPEEFCEEMEADKDAIDRRIVRVTFLREASKLSPNIFHISVIASYSVDGQIVKLQRYCGDIWKMNQEQDDKVWGKANEIAKAITDKALALFLEVRPGSLEE